MGRHFENRKESMAKTAGAKTKIYSKYGKEIYVCAKNGSTDPDSNLTLRRLIERAKKDQVPTHVIDKAIAKAEGGGGEDFHSARYEGFGPAGTVLIVDCLTDNNNRTIGDVRTCFNKAKAKIAAPGAVAHLFDHRAIFCLKHEDEDAVLEAMMEADVDVADVEGEDGIVTVLAEPNEFFNVKTALAASYPDIKLEVEEISYLPQERIEIAGEDLEKFEKLLEFLEDCDDVQQVYHNASFA